MVGNWPTSGKRGFGMQRAIATLDRVDSASCGGVAEGTWQTEAIEQYRLAKIGEEHALRAELADRVASLAGRRVAPSLIAVDRDARLAVLALDGVRFRLQHHEVVLLRPCAHWGTGEVASDPLITKGE